MDVVFSTYHSIDVISDAQKKHGLAEFDLVICDEAHRTTGATFEGDDESHFVKVHDAGFIRSAKRLYMTATPRIYGENAKASAAKDNVALASMDDVKLFGKPLYVLTFSEAVKRALLSDYKVIVLAVEETAINRRLQKLLSSGDNDLRMDDAARIVGCWKALSKQGLTHDLADDDHPMQRAVAFCQVIEAKQGAKTHKVGSKNIARMFQAVVEEYQRTAKDEGTDEEIAATLKCEAEHVDGSMNASEKEARLDWLKAVAEENTCRILSNVRCLSEGVDVPALDAVLFLTPRNSQVDVVQAVGRVMRKAHGKQRGYIILPVVIPAGVEPHEALNDNVTYKVVWQVLQALRSHDDRFDAMVNKLDLIGSDPTKMEVVAVTDKVQRRAANLRVSKSQQQARKARGGQTIGHAVADDHTPEQVALQFQIGEIEKAIYAKLVQKVGNRHHWEDWANDIAKIAQTHIDRIKAILENPENKKERKAFNAFAAELRDDLNDKITDAEIIETLAQHLITKPVFEALFEGHEFTRNNPVSRAMEKVLALLEQHHLDKEADTLTKFYDSVKLRAEGITSAEGQQKIIKELYDKFFNGAFPELSKRLGIVYTPVEVVDFIIHSVQHVLKSEFNASLGDKGVHILDPFTGTGTFITRLIQSELITKTQLPYKYQHELHANEIVLLAYYIASINIERAYHDIAGGDYVPFEGICLTDTFQMGEKGDLVDALLVDNSKRRKRQMALDIRVILGNPPYSVGQRDAEDDNQNIAYPQLDERISRTYAAHSSARTRTNVYDSYIRAIRWASDRIGNSGVIGFVTNASFLDANASDGLRKCLVNDFSDIYVFHLRGLRGQKTSGERAKKEGGQIFGMGSSAAIAITLLVKNPDCHDHGRIFFHDIGDYLSREDKLAIVSHFGSIAGVGKEQAWQAITPDAYGDWLRQRDDSFNEFIVMGDKKSTGTVLFENYSFGPITHRDTWVYNFSRSTLGEQVSGMLAFYNEERCRYQAAATELEPVKFVTKDERKIAWDDKLFRSIKSDKAIAYFEHAIVRASYRPFTAMYFYLDRACIWSAYQMPYIFCDRTAKNVVINVTGSGAKQFSALVMDCVPDIQTQFNGQCFPLYLYDEAATGVDAPAPSLFDQPKGKPGVPARRNAITDAGLAHFQSAYPGEKLTKEDLFYYVYGLLHSPDYRERYADNLAKELPRIPRVKTAADFWAFSKAGRALADLHLNYETVPMYTKASVIGSDGKAMKLDDAKTLDSRFRGNDEREKFWRVEKMKVPKTGGEKDLTRLIYNSKITITGIPSEAYDYVVNGKPALDWVIERQCVKKDKASGIVNDANDWAIETMHNPRYPLELFLRVITVSLETMKIVRALPALDILPN
jgi:predicted helicase